MKLVFMGTPEFAVKCLNKLHNSEHEILAVVTIPDKAQGRGKKVQPSPLKLAAEALNYRLLQPVDLNSIEFQMEIKKINPEIIIVVAFKILPERIFSLPVFGTVNIHASLLPKYRGAAPINHALLNGEKKTGVTSFYITENIDAGTILLQKEIEIEEKDDFGSLYNKLAELGAELLVETLDQLDTTGIPFKVQNQADVTSAPKINREMCAINWNTNGMNIVNQVRAFSPKPAAFTGFNKLQLKILKADFKPTNDFGSNQNGEIVEVSKKHISIKVPDGVILPQIVQLQGKKEMPISAFLNGNTILLNTRLDVIQ